MKLVIASDLHGAAPAVRALAARIEAEAPDRVLLLGDLLYHGPRNDLPEGYAPREVAAVLNGMAARITAVRGNCDAEVDQMVLDFPCLADYALVEADGHLLYLTHGHVPRMTPDDPPALAPGSALPHRPHPREGARRPRRRAVREPRQHIYPEGRRGGLCRVRARGVRAQVARRRDARGRRLVGAGRGTAPADAGANRVRSLGGAQGSTAGALRPAPCRPSSGGMRGSRLSRNFSISLSHAGAQARPMHQRARARPRRPLRLPAQRPASHPADENERGTA